MQTKAKVGSCMLRRVGRDGVFVYWSRLGWSDIYGGPLERDEAVEIMCKTACSIAALWFYAFLLRRSDGKK